MFLYGVLLCCFLIPVVCPADYLVQQGAVLPFDCCCSLIAFLLMSILHLLEKKSPNNNISTVIKIMYKKSSP